jgi:hypothetical protein
MRNSWLAQLIGRRNKNVAAVALANKNARIVWALLAHERDYQPATRRRRHEHGLPTGAARRVPMGRARDRLWTTLRSQQHHRFLWRSNPPPIAQAIMT